MGHLEHEHEWEEIWEDHILMGSIYYGRQCKECLCMDPTELPGPLELGTYK